MKNENWLYNGLGDHPLQSVTLSEDNKVITFAFATQGVKDIRFRVEGDCCSQSWIEHLEAPDSVVGRVIVEVDDLPAEVAGEEVKPPEEGLDDCIQIYQTIFRLDNGESIKLEYRNASNGYYGGYLEREDAE